MQKKINILLRLTRYKLSFTVSFSAVTGYLLTGNSSGTVILLVFSGVFLLACGSSALNQVQEQRFDSMMERTRHRPLPLGEISIFYSLLISFMLLFSGFLLLLTLDFIPAALGLANVFLYNLVYTPLKRMSTLSIVPGALVGAICPLIGWTAGNFPVFHPVALFISIFIFLWQIPHFWLLLLQYGEDFKRAGFPVVFNLNRSGIKILVFVWIVFTSLFLFSFPLFGYKGRFLTIPVIFTINLLFISLFYKLLFRKTSKQKFQLAFILINSFAIVVFCILIISRI